MMGYCGRQRSGFSTISVHDVHYPQSQTVLALVDIWWVSMKDMDTISRLIREDTERLSGGRIASVVQIDGQPVRLISSARRKKTVSASVRNGMIQLSVPVIMTDAEIIESARSLIAKIKVKQRQAQQFHTNSDLLDRALHLARVWLNNEVFPTSVVWSDRQTTLWGSCTSTTGAIRISTMLQGMPQWVIDGVLIHEMAHLKYGGHGRQFQEFSGRYPRMAEADAFLDGVSFAQQRDQDRMLPNAYD